MTGPEDRGRLRASHADREQVIEVLKLAFVQGRLVKDELDERVGQAMAARTYAELDALTADIPAGLAPPREPVRAPAGRRMNQAAIVAAWAIIVAGILVGAFFFNPLGLSVAVLALFGAGPVAVILTLDSRRDSGRQPPPRSTRRRRPLEGAQDDIGDDLIRCEPLRHTRRAPPWSTAPRLVPTAGLS